MASSDRAEVSEYLVASTHAEERWDERIGRDPGAVEAYQQGQEINPTALPGVDAGRCRYHRPTDALLPSMYDYVDERRVIVTVLLVNHCYAEVRRAVTEEVASR